MLPINPKELARVVIKVHRELRHCVERDRDALERTIERALCGAINMTYQDAAARLEQLSKQITVPEAALALNLASHRLLRVAAKYRDSEAMCPDGAKRTV